MKSFYISVVLFALVLTAIVCNVVYIRRTTDVLSERLNAMPAMESAASEVGALCDLWATHEKKIAISASRVEIENMRGHLIDMEAALRTGDAFQFEKARLAALETVSEIRQLEEFGWDNLI